MSIDLKDLTPDQRKALAAEALEAEKSEAKKMEADRQAYKELISEKVETLFPKLREMGDLLSETKEHIYAEFKGALEMKYDLYEVSESQDSHTFTNKAGTKRIILGYHMKDDYDDTVSEGVEKVKQYISSLSRDRESEMLVRAVMKLLSRDQKGNLKPSRVTQLRQMARDSESELFMDGVRIIDDAYRPVRTKTYIQASWKNEIGEWVSIALSMTEA